MVRTMCGKTAVRWVGIGVLSAAAGLAQETVLPSTAIRIDLPKDSPVALLTLDPRDSRFTPRGGAASTASPCAWCRRKWPWAAGPRCAFRG